MLKESAAPSWLGGRAISALRWESPTDASEVVARVWFGEALLLGLAHDA